MLTIFFNDLLLIHCSYIFLHSNVNGCLHTDSLNLTINNSDTSYTNITACDSLVWNGTTYTQSGTYSYNGSSNILNNYSLMFDGIDDYVLLNYPYLGTPTGMNPTGDHSFMFWIQNNKPSCQGQGQILSDYNQPASFNNHLNLFYGGCSSNWYNTSCAGGNCLAYEFYGNTLVTTATSIVLKL